MNSICDCERCQRTKLGVEEVLCQASDTLAMVSQTLEDLMLIGDDDLLYGFQDSIDTLFMRSAEILDKRIFN